MPGTPSKPTQPPSLPRRFVEGVGDAAYRAGDELHDAVERIGGMIYLFVDAVGSVREGLRRRRSQLGRAALVEQMTRVGVRSIPIVLLVQVFIGIILALQMAPTLEAYGQKIKVADIVAIAIIRELGPLITAIVLSGFAGASIAAELGAMVEGEEIKAMKATALNPVQYLVMPRVLSTITMLTGLAVLADIIGVFGGLLTSTLVLNIDVHSYISETRLSLAHRDFLTGLVKAAVFGLLISLIACYEGLNVKGGAVGVGKATTATVVRSIVALIATDCVFTAVFYSLGW